MECSALIVINSVTQRPKSSSTYPKHIEVFLKLMLCTGGLENRVGLVWKCKNVFFVFHVFYNKMLKIFQINILMDESPELVPVPLQELSKLQIGQLYPFR